MSGDEGAAPVLQLAAGAHYDFSVSDPMKKAKQRTLDLSYWTYQIHTKTNLEELAGAAGERTYHTVRRYSDFAWLREVLVEENPGVIVPPIPEKSLRGALEKVSGDGPSSLRDYRQRAMRKFLIRVGAHRMLCAAKPFVQFFTVEEQDFQAVLKEVRKKPEVELGNLEKVTLMKNTTLGAKSRAVQETAWEEARQHVVQLENSLVLMRERVDLLVKRRRDSASSLNEFGKAFARVGEVERGFEGGALSSALVDVGHHSELLAQVYAQQAETETTQVTETIGYYIGLCQAIKDVIKRLQRIALTRDLLETNLSSLKDEKVAAESKKPQKVPALEKDIKETADKLEKAEALLESSSKTFDSEMQRFQKEKQYDIKQLLRAFVELQLEHANKIKKSWETLLPSVEQIRTE